MRAVASGCSICDSQQDWCISSFPHGFGIDGFVPILVDPVRVKENNPLAVSDPDRMNSCYQRDPKEGCTNFRLHISFRAPPRCGLVGPDLGRPVCETL